MMHYAINIIRISWDYSKFYAIYTLQINLSIKFYYILIISVNSNIKIVL